MRWVGPSSGSWVQGVGQGLPNWREVGVTSGCPQPASWGFNNSYALVLWGSAWHQTRNRGSGTVTDLSL